MNVFGKFTKKFRLLGKGSEKIQKINVFNLDTFNPIKNIICKKMHAVSIHKFFPLCGNSTL